MHDFAILIPTRNRPEILRRTLQELKQLGFGSRPLLVYDDESLNQDAVTRVVHEEWPAARLILGKKRMGQAAGRNVLLRECPCELALCMDDDSFPESAEWINTYLEADWSGRRWAVATFQYKSIADGKLSITGSTEPREAIGFLGGCSMVHVPSLMSVGGYRDFFIYGFEEPELALRLRLAGFKMWQDPQVVILHNHLETASENRDYREYDYLYSRNGVLLSSLNLPLPMGLAMGFARSLRLILLRRRSRMAKTLGLLVGVAMTFQYWRERNPCSWSKALSVLHDRN